MADPRAELEELRRLDALEAKAAAGRKAPTEKFVPSGMKDSLDWSSPEVIAAQPILRVAKGAASPFLGLFQLGMNLGKDGPGTERAATNAHLKQYEDLTNEGTGGGFDPYQFAGAVLSPAGLKVAGAMKAAPTVLGRVGQGAALGAAAGASTPVTEGDNFWASKGAQTATGAAVGGAIPLGVDAMKKGAGVARDIADLFTEKGAGRILTRYQGKIIGEDGRQAVIDALKASKEPVPGYKPTAAEAVAKIPEGSPVIAHQKITAATPGGPSAAFGKRVLDQKAALERAVEARAEATGPLREAALTAANNTPQFSESIGAAARRFMLTGKNTTEYGVKASDVTHGLKTALGQPGLRASDVVTKTLDKVKDKIASLTDETGRIDARDLYTVRKEIGNTIRSFAKETSNWDKKLTAGIERDVQRAIDKSIESAGGTGWKQYLQEFTAHSAGMESAKDAVKAAAKPAQRTNLGGGMNVTEETRLHLPNMLSRPMMLANAVMKRVGSGIEPRLDAEATRRYLNPQAFAQELEKLPPQQQSVMSAMLQRLGIIGGAQTIADQEQF